VASFCIFGEFGEVVIFDLQKFRRVFTLKIAFLFAVFAEFAAVDE
jgi:hypothetical protein